MNTSGQQHLSDDPPWLVARCKGGSMTPEQSSRQNIDQQLTLCGWIVQNFREMDISAGRGIAVREFPFASVPVDYLLYVDGMAIGTVEAKREESTQSHRNCCGCSSETAAEQSSVDHLSCR